MAYFVRYGFGKDLKLLEEKFLRSYDDYEDNDTKIRTYSCLAKFIGDRKNKTESIDNPIYYSLSCYKPWLEELIDWINSLNLEIEVKFIKSRVFCYLIHQEYKRDLGDYVYKIINGDFEFGKSYTQVPKEQTENLNSLQIHRCAVTISVPKGKINLPKILLEYLILTLFRTLSINEDYFHNMNPNGSIISRIISGATNRKGSINHCLYENYLTEENLIKCLDINNVEKVCDGEIYTGKEDGQYKISQTPLIDSILERIK